MGRCGFGFDLAHLAIQRLGVARLLPSSPSLVDAPSADAEADAHAVDLDRMLQLSNAFLGKVALLTPDNAAAVRKLNTRLSFFDERRVNAAAWHAELLETLARAPAAAAAASASTASTSSAVAADGAAEATLVGLTGVQHRRWRALLFYRHCEFSLSLMAALTQRIKAEHRQLPPSSELMLEFWTSIASLRCCTEPSVTEPIPDDVRRAGVALLRLVATRRQACGLQKKQGVRLLDWVKQAELGGIVPLTATPVAAAKPVPAAAAAATAGGPAKRGWVRPVKASAAAAIPKEAQQQKRRNKKKQRAKRQRTGAAAAPET